MYSKYLIDLYTGILNTPEKAVEAALDLLKTQEVKLLPQPADPIRVLRPQK